jgi:general secretion pathway protein G
MNKERAMSNPETRKEAAKAAGRSARDAGFTLLEIMIVLAIIALIAGSVGLGLFSYFKKAQVKVAKEDVRSISHAIQLYMIDSNECPKGMDDLVAKKNLPKIMKDPWGKDFIIKCPGQNDTDGADVSSPGPDKQEGTADDINSWQL